MADPNAVLEATIEAQVTESNQARAAEGKAPHTAAEVAALRARALDALRDKHMRRAAQLIKEGGATDFKAMAVMSGAPGAVPLVHAMIDNCPGLTAETRARLRGQIKLPYDIVLDPSSGRSAGQKIEIGARGSRPAAEFMLHCGAASAGHDMGAELAKLRPFLTDTEMEKIRNQCGHLMFLARQTYAQVLALNQDLLGEMREGMARLPTFDPTAIHIDDANTTFYLGDGTKKWEPRCGLFVARC